jgi:molybdopterin-guanine dinucleotide biosynthesis protein A
VRTLGLLIAGGRGRRLSAGRPKALVEVAGRTLLERALACLSACADEVRVVAPRALGLPVDDGILVEDPPGEQGPLAALVAGLGAADHERAIVLGVDYPLARPGFLAALAELLEDRSKAYAVIPEAGGMLQPLVAAYSPAARPLLADRLERGERALVAAVRTLEPRIVAEAEWSTLEGGAENFVNVNTPADLDAVAQRLRARS